MSLDDLSGGGDKLSEYEPEKSPAKSPDHGSEHSQINLSSDYLQEEGEGENDEPTRPPEEAETSIDGERDEEDEEEEDLFEDESWAPCEEKPPSFGEGGEEEEEEEAEEELGEEEEEEEESIEEKISLDSEFLKSTLGTPLTHALLDIIAKRPTDPIHYLGHYLIKWRADIKNKAEYDEEIKALTSEREKHMMKMREKERQKMLAKEQQEEGRRRCEKTESSMGDEDLSSVSYEDDTIMSEKGSSPTVESLGMNEQMNE